MSGLSCLFLVLMTCLWACSPTRPASGDRQGDAASAKGGEENGRVEKASGPKQFVEHEIGEGETLWDIARAYGVSVGEIQGANELSQRDTRRLRKGAILLIPGAERAADVETASDRARRKLDAATHPPEGSAFHELADGETLWDLAHAYERTLDQIMTLNAFSDNDVRSLRAGRLVAIPDTTEADIQRKTEERARAPEQELGITHRLQEGETIWDLAGMFQVGVGQLMAANRLSESEVTALRPGTRLRIPGVTEDARGRVVRRRTGAQRRAARLAARLGLGTRQTASKLLRGQVEARWIRAAGGRRGRLPGTLRWPVTNGGFVRGFGSGEGGYHLAVDISGDIGWNVRAAAGGIVGYSGNEVRGYGNLVMVIHQGGWVTMYAHNSSNFVVAGERVVRGAVLAEVGSTGISRGPHVHFEWMYNGRNCDPATLFRPGIKHRNGRVSRVARNEWTDPDRKPPSIACHRRRRHPRSRWVVNE